MSRGHDRERLVQDWLQERGWWVCRAAGSLGDADLVALMDVEVDEIGEFPPELDGEVIHDGKLLIEVKSTKAGPFAGFGPKDRAELLAAGEMAGARVVLCWAPPQRRAFEKTELHWIWPDRWPKRRST